MHDVTSGASTGTSTPARRVACLTLSQKVCAESLTASTQKVRYLFWVGLISGSPSFKYNCKVFSADSPTGTTRSLEPLPLTRTKADSVSTACNSKPHLIRKREGPIHTSVL
jgi:hypothetical protein